MTNKSPKKSKPAKAKKKRDRKFRLLSMNTTPEWLAKLDLWIAKHAVATGEKMNRTQTVNRAVDHFYRTWRP